MGWLDISQIVNDFQIQVDKIVYLAAINNPTRNEERLLSTDYSDESKPQLQILYNDGKKLTGYKEISALGQIQTEKLLEEIDAETSTFS